MTDMQALHKTLDVARMAALIAIAADPWCTSQALEEAFSLGTSAPAAQPLSVLFAGIQRAADDDALLGCADALLSAIETREALESGVIGWEAVYPHLASEADPHAAALEMAAGDERDALAFWARVRGAA